MPRADLEHQTRRTVGVSDAAAYLGVNRRTVQRYLEKGWLPCERLPSGYRRIPRVAVITFRQQAEDRAQAC